jgi:hypothetical protein
MRIVQALGSLRKCLDLLRGRLSVLRADRLGPQPNPFGRYFANTSSARVDKINRKPNVRSHSLDNATIAGAALNTVPTATDKSQLVRYF